MYCVHPAPSLLPVLVSFPHTSLWHIHIRFTVGQFSKKKIKKTSLPWYHKLHNTVHRRNVVTYICICKSKRREKWKPGLTAPASSATATAIYSTVTVNASVSSIEQASSRLELAESEFGSEPKSSENVRKTGWEEKKKKDIFRKKDSHLFLFLKRNPKKRERRKGKRINHVTRT